MVKQKTAIISIVTFGFWVIVIFLQFFVGKQSAMVKPDEARIFDREIWNSFPKKRFSMVEDVIFSKVLLGKTCDEVVQLLGAPDDQVPSSGDSTPQSFYYVLDHWEFKTFDSASLHIQFRNGVATDAKLLLN